MAGAGIHPVSPSPTVGVPRANFPQRERKAMLKRGHVNGNLSRGARGLGIAVALSIGISACGAGHAVTDAVGVARMAAQRVTAGTPSMPTGITVPAGQPAATAASATTAASAPKAAATVAAAAKGAAHSAGVPASGGAAAVAAPTSSAATTAAALGARRQPTATEISQAIRAVHQLVPFFTPTAKQVAHVGDQVCSALDQGMTFSQVKSKVSAMLGHFSWLLPSAVPTQGVRTVVALYCPGYASKVA